MLEVRLLGRFEVKHRGKVLPISSRPAQSLFSYLILMAGIPHRREKLAGMLWPDSLEETARDNLRHSLWRVRKAFQSASATHYLQANDITVAFNASADYWLDAAEVKKLSETASADELIVTLSEYQGELLPGFYDEWVMSEREHLHSIFEHHMARLLSLLQEEKRWLDILDWGERWIKLGQKPEPAYRALMRAHAAKGDMSKVAATYERCMKSLKEFGIEPSEQTQTLYESLKKNGKETRKMGSTIPAVEKRRSLPRTNLPVPITSFIGREKEVDEILRLFSRNRLVTLVGTGGVGKTRLAIQSSHRLVDTFKDGVWWVDLVGLSDPALIPQEVAKTLDVHEVPNQPLIETLVGEFQAKQALLVLDNCEHLIVACAQLADRFLSGTRHLKILATSREPLDILGETVWLVPSLSLPDVHESEATKVLSKYESVRLFIERATALQPHFNLTDQNAGAVVQICRRLSGMPLAIELAAARVKMMTAEEIANRLDDRFSLLTAGSRTAMPRHQTLRATIDWSYDLLTEPERILFRRLAVFAGGCTLEAAEMVCGQEELKQSEILDLLGHLVDKSLVIVEQASIGEGTRFRLLETIRQYAHEKLEQVEAAAVRNHHVEFYMNLAEEAEPQLELVHQGTWLDRLENEMDNIRAATDWALASRQINLALRLVGALRRFWVIRNHDAEGLERIKVILNHPDARQPTSACLKAMNTYFFMLWPHGRLKEAHSLIESAIEIGAKLGDHRQEAVAYLWAGVSAIEQGDYPRARSYLEQSRDQLRDYGHIVDLALSLVFLGELSMSENNYEDAAGFFEAAISPFREARDYPFLGMLLRRQGQLVMSQGDFLKAVAFIKESLLHNWAIHDYRGAGACLAALASLSLAKGETGRAIQLLGVVDAILEFIRTPLLPYDQQQYERNVSQLRAQVQSSIFEKAWSTGHTIPLEQAVEFELKGAQA